MHFIVGQIKEHEVDGACIVQGELSTKFWLEGLKGRPRYRREDNIRMDILGI
jgi:hypothetical protein